VSDGWPKRIQTREAQGLLWQVVVSKKKALNRTVYRSGLTRQHYNNASPILAFVDIPPIDRIRVFQFASVHKTTDAVCSTHFRRRGFNARIGSYLALSKMTVSRIADSVD
jgi:hypothetical protein